VKILPVRGLARCLLPALALAILVTALQTPVAAQTLGRTEQLTREQTVELIGRVLADIQATFPSPAQALSLEKQIVEQIIHNATAQIMDLRDALSDNYHIQVLSFSIDLPSGISVRFGFPPEDRGE
jgi:hypothetical protein